MELPAREGRGRREARDGEQEGARSRVSSLRAPSVPRLEVPIERFTLSSGAILLVSRRVGAPVTAVHAHVRGGPAQDPPGYEGTAFLAGSLLDQGTREFGEQRLAELLEPNGGDLSGD